MKPGFLPLFLLASLLIACSDHAAAPATTGATATSAVTVTPEDVSPTAAAAKDLIGPASHEGSRANAHVRALATEIGPRVAGSGGERRAAEYIAAQFASWGYAVEKPEFSYTGDRFRAATLTVAGRRFEAITMDGSAGGNVSGSAIFVGIADEAGLSGKSVTGKVAVADRGTLTFAEKYDAVRAAGAVGLVIINTSDGQLNGRTATGAKFPVLGAAGEDGVAIREAAKAGERFELASSGNAPSKGLNVLARRTAGAACDVLVGGHYDTVPNAPGANDNASGTANVLEVARAMAADGLDSGVCFAAFSAEESGLFGSAAMLEQLSAEGHSPKTMVNLDVTGIGSRVELIGDRNGVSAALEMAKGLGIDAKRSELPTNSGSDHQTFQQAGIPAIWFFSGEFESIHSPGDVANDIDERELDRVGDLALAVVKDLLRQFARG
ncbi:MAG: M28 family metallopeptidase [Tepidiformaceae bacterium]